MYELPIFPLNTVLFPGMPLRLHIFEERYKLMLKHVLATNRTFGVCLIKVGLEAHGPLALPFATGCTARIIQVDPLEDGRMNLTAVGDERFHILKHGSADPYLNAFVESMPLNSHHSIEVLRGSRSLRQRVTAYLNLLTRYSDSQAGKDDMPLDLDIDLTNLQLPEDPLLLIYLSAALLQIPAVEKQPLLEAETAADLLFRVQRMYRRELALMPGMIDNDPDSLSGAAWVN